MVVRCVYTKTKKDNLLHAILSSWHLVEISAAGSKLASLAKPDSSGKNILPSEHFKFLMHI